VCAQAFTHVAHIHTYGHAHIIHNFGHAHIVHTFHVMIHALGHAHAHTHTHTRDAGDDNGDEALAPATSHTSLEHQAKLRAMATSTTKLLEETSGYMAGVRAQVGWRQLLLPVSLPRTECMCACWCAIWACL
jgi:hypothetical protein